MANVIGSPERYVQGREVLKDLCKHVQSMGNAPFILVSQSGKGRVEAPISEGAKELGTKLVYEIFGGESSRNEINRLQKAYEASGCDVVVGIGGGKIHDTAKALAYYAKAPVVIVPTIAGTDAPCSALSVLYTDDGVFEDYLFLPRNPNMVLVDTEIISKAPARLLVAGMGDALATYFEARACQQSDSGNFIGGKYTVTSMALAKLCYDTLIADGVKALTAVEAGVCTKALENIIEANTYLSGIGFESCGIAAAHAIHNGLTAIEETHDCYHGEKVAFGTLTQLVLENAPKEELEEVLHFCMDVGLPTTLKGLGIHEINKEELMQVAEIACGPNDTMGNMPFTVTPQMLYDAILATDALGKRYQAKTSSPA
ncbi:glycerol 2-dehydrogenase (NAD+) [Tindallia magadiensis]|uniref:Glycerol dehydrogenase n=1 Tax=Tindallia magadiensis TaxID=69895 RepID=A0A1I3HLW5_9FIRM|nr:glycerol dehydrogenase [Tindallia magadiensis]SFI36714.1 glycerol 2-dehydrogenase (NAD+) [Tindallia magadiensis]